MTYQAATEWLFAQLPMFQRQGKTAFKPGLDRIRSLCSYLNHPESKIPAIHIGGTNGKGSLSHILASILQTHGLKTGLYTSPHLVDFRERIRINGEVISEKAVIQFTQNFRNSWTSEMPSFFELGVAMALDYFAKESVDVAIIEVGMGGRLDATSVVHPILTAITNIGLDHTQYLGDTRALIAAEKAAIARAGVPMILGEPDDEILPVFEKTCQQTGAPLHVTSNTLVPTHWQTDLGGHYQKMNLRTLKKIIEHLPFSLSDNTITSGLKNVVKNTGLRGRWEIAGQKPTVILDTAHNAEGLKYTMQQLSEMPEGTRHIVFGVVADKDLDKIITLLPRNAFYYLCAPDVPRALKVDELGNIFQKNHLNFSILQTVESAYLTAKNKAKINDIIYIGGSTFVVSDVLKIFNK
ncbi:MAG: bifunctional folylpolyglutamate synthase/dihydrofolate synthase [Cryomorphaceae bacterium]|nr:bifunctional folylpolyglutamate synthase/dihydrofolate synthase [Cryomorphaceae bacterium]